MPSSKSHNTISNTIIKIKKSKTTLASQRTPLQVSRRNERERKRVEQVNKGFHELRDRVPHSATSKKLSKVETLREAVRYIKYLRDYLNGIVSGPFIPRDGTQNESPSNDYPQTSNGFSENYYSIINNNYYNTSSSSSISTTTYNTIAYSNGQSRSYGIPSQYSNQATTILVRNQSERLDDSCSNISLSTSLNCSNQFSSYCVTY